MIAKIWPENFWEGIAGKIWEEMESGEDKQTERAGRRWPPPPVGPLSLFRWFGFGKCMRRAGLTLRHRGDEAGRIGLQHAMTSLSSVCCSPRWWAQWQGGSLGRCRPVDRARITPRPVFRVSLSSRRWRGCIRSATESCSMTVLRRACERPRRFARCLPGVPCSGPLPSPWLGLVPRHAGRCDGRRHQGAARRHLAGDEADAVDEQRAKRRRPALRARLFRRGDNSAVHARRSGGRGRCRSVRQRARRAGVLD